LRYAHGENLEKEIFPMPDYPQMPPLSPDEIETFLNRPLLAKISSVNKDGTIHSAPLLFGYENGDVLLGTQTITRKVANVRRNPMVTVLVDDPGPPPKGLIIYGQASLDYDHVIEKRVAVFEKYGRSPEQALAFTQALANKWEPVIIRVRPDRIVSFDYSKGSLV
jgi:hypothetical protein